MSVCQDPAATEQCVASIQHRHMVESLRAWRQWREDGCPDHQDLGRSQLQHHGRPTTSLPFLSLPVSLHLMCQWLAHSSDNSELVHEVSTTYLHTHTHTHTHTLDQ